MTRQVSSTKDSSPKVDRRKFLTGVAVAGAAGAIAPQAAQATVADGTAAARLRSALPPTTQTIAAETNVPAAEINRICHFAAGQYKQCRDAKVTKQVDEPQKPAD